MHVAEMAEWLNTIYGVKLYIWFDIYMICKQIVGR